MQAKVAHSTQKHVGKKISVFSRIVFPLLVHLVASIQVDCLKSFCDKLHQLLMPSSSDANNDISDIETPQVSRRNLGLATPKSRPGYPDLDLATYPDLGLATRFNGRFNVSMAGSMVQWVNT